MKILTKWMRCLLTMGKGMSLGMVEEELAGSPVQQFEKWFKEAEASGVLLPESMVLATVDEGGKPAARMMLMKGFDEDGFRFFTHYQSRKGIHLESNKHAALVFHWAVLQRQVRVEGEVERLTVEESQAYFSTRPRGSRIGAWASMQSMVLESRQVLEAAVQNREREYAGQRVIPVPPYWGGYRLRPERMEFWQGRVHRLHDRVRYDRSDSGWDRVRLYP